MTEKLESKIGSRFGLDIPKMDFSPPDYETLKKFKLVYHDGKPKTPAFCNISTVWALGIEENEPVYALYDGGTNALVILEKTPGNDWKEIELKEIKNLYGLMWRMVSGIINSNNSEKV